jgi:hypothetical protein
LHPLRVLTPGYHLSHLQGLVWFADWRRLFRLDATWVMWIRLDFEAWSQAISFLPDGSSVSFGFKSYAQPA